MNKHAVLIGATGSTGKDLLELLLKDDTFDKVDVFVRRSLDLHHNKLNTYVFFSKLHITVLAMNICIADVDVSAKIKQSKVFTI